MKISVILPCRNEEKTISLCIQKINKALQGKYDYEIIISDSSKDRSSQIAEKFKKTKIVKHKQVGYGNAINKGVEKSMGEIIIIGDCDNTYDFLETEKIIKQLRTCDLVIGSRYKGKIEKGAMPITHKYLGTPLINLLIKILYKKWVTDANSGFRGIKKQKLQKLKLKSKGMEYASEMIIKAIKNKYKIKEVGVNYKKRVGKSKLKTIKDGKRHIKLILKMRKK